jgi:hypothetical protein
MCPSEVQRADLSCSVGTVSGSQHIDIVSVNGFLASLKILVSLVRFRPSAPETAYDPALSLPAVRWDLFLPAYESRAAAEVLSDLSS